MIIIIWNDYCWNWLKKCFRRMFDLFKLLAKGRQFSHFSTVSWLNFNIFLIISLFFQVHSRRKLIQWQISSMIMWFRNCTSWISICVIFCSDCKQSGGKIIRYYHFFMFKKVQGSFAQDSLKILWYNIHSPWAWRISLTILLLMTEYTFKPMYSKRGDSLFVLCSWCVDVELLLTRFLTLQRITWPIDFTGSENPNSSKLFPNNNKFNNTIRSEGNNSLVKEPVKLVTVSLNNNQRMVRNNI